MRAELESDGITAAIGSTKQQSTLKDIEKETAADQQNTFCCKKEHRTAFTFYIHFKNLYIL